MQSHFTPQPVISASSHETQRNDCEVQKCQALHVGAPEHRTKLQKVTRKASDPPDPRSSQVTSACPAVLFEAARNATTHATTQASSLPPSTPSTSWATLGAAHGTTTHSLSRVYSRSMMLLLGKFGAPPGMLIHNRRRASNAPSLHPSALPHLPPQH